MAMKPCLQLTFETAFASSFALMALILTNCCLEAQRATALMQYFQIFHSDEGRAGQIMSLDNASRIVLLGSHKYDICCYIQPRDSQTQIQFDASMFEERISNYRHRQSVSSCIHSRLSGLQRTTLQRRLRQSSNSSLSGIVQCRGLSSDDMTSIVGWFGYEISVSAELTCNFAKLLTEEEFALDQPRLVFRCKLTQGWPSSVLNCRIDSDDSSSVNSSDVRIRVDEESAENSSISVELVSWWQHHGSRLVCRARQECPVGKVCHGDLTADGATVDARLMFRVRSSSSCVFTERPDLGRTLARCNSSQGWPSVQHSCKLVSDAGETPLVGNRVVSNNSTVVSLFSTPKMSSAEVVAANTTIECVAQQTGFPALSYNYVFVYEEKATLFTASLDLAPIIVSLVILLVIIIVILGMVATAIRRRRQPASAAGLAAAGGGKGSAADQNCSGKAAE